MKKLTIAFLFTITFSSISFADSISATQYTYTCVSKDSSGEYVHLTINAEGNQSLVSIDGEPADLDATYSPRSLGKFRFVYRKNGEGTNFVVIQKELQSGAAHGFIALQWRGDAFSQTVFECFLE